MYTNNTQTYNTTLFILYSYKQAAEETLELKGNIKPEHTTSVEILSDWGHLGMDFLLGLCRYYCLDKDEFVPIDFTETESS